MKIIYDLISISNNSRPYALFKILLTPNDVCWNKEKKRLPSSKWHETWCCDTFYASSSNNKI